MLTLRARRLVVTTGITDELPEVAGLDARFGRDVIHCPYCHGWEVRDLPIAVIGVNTFATHQALLFSQWSPDVTLVVHDPSAAPGPDDRERLAARGVRVVEGGPIESVRVDGDALTGLRLVSGNVVDARAAAVMPTAVARAGFVADLGLELAPVPMGAGTRIEVDAAQGTSVAGVWAAGNVTDPSQQVVAAAAGGVVAGARANFDLLEEDTAALVAEARAGA